MILATEIKRKIHFWTLAIGIMFLLPVPPVASFAVVFGMLNWLFGGDYATKFKRFLHPLPLLWSGLFFVYLLGMIYTEETSTGWRNIETKLTLVLYPILFFSGEKLSKTERGKLLDYFAYSVLAVSIYTCAAAIFQYATTGVSSFAYKALAAHIGAHPGYVALFSALAFFIFVFKIIKNTKSRSGLGFYLKGAAAVWLLLFIAMLSARMVLLSVVLLSGISGLVYVIRRGMFFRGILYLSLGAVLAASVMWTLPHTRMRIQSIFSSENAQPAYLGVRYQLWDSALQVYQKSFILGVGTGDVQSELNKVYTEKGYAAPLEKHLNLHNQYLQTLAAIGIVGLLLLLLNLLVPFILSVRRRYYLYLLFLGLFILANLTESLLERQHGVMLFAFFQSLFALDFLPEKK